MCEKASGHRHTDLGGTAMATTVPECAEDTHGRSASTTRLSKRGVEAEIAPRLTAEGTPNAAGPFASVVRAARAAPDDVQPEYRAQTALPKFAS
ncbi:hypothetical protein [Streptomyces sp. NPDC005438]|uniref:hypothetical protein n=1 Tax=Streptomyces sp. NPDC005438 TaxID=3156880 RepID=UPI0033B7AD8B